MSKPALRRLPNGEPMLDYTEVARRIKRSITQVKTDTVQKKSLTAEEVGNV